MPVTSGKEPPLKVHAGVAVAVAVAAGKADDGAAEPITPRLVPMRATTTDTTLTVH
jgi:hypothetical protein